jgi:competence ComEA-like helix-hairpin-helix protein
MSHYTIFELEKYATIESIKLKYKELALKYHPDKGKTDDEKKTFEEKFKKINEAKTVLMDEKLKKKYDDDLKKEQKVKTEIPKQNSFPSKQELYDGSCFTFESIILTTGFFAFASTLFHIIQKAKAYNIITKCNNIDDTNFASHYRTFISDIYMQCKYYGKRPNKYDGYILIGTRFNENNNMYFIEKTARKPMTRIAEWGNRNLKYQIQCRDHDFAEKAIHYIFKNNRIKRQRVDGNGNEIEWFELNITIEQLNAIIGTFINVINTICHEYIPNEINKDKYKININTATRDELMMLYGIGKNKSSKIIYHRTFTAKFEKIEDIMNVPYIKTGRFSYIKDYITV